MSYIIEKVNLLKNGQIEQTSFLVKENRISLIKPSMKNYTYMRMNADPFIMTAPHVTLNTQIPFDQPFCNQKEYYIDHFIKKGITTFLTKFSIQYEFELEKKLAQFKKGLLNCPIDYAIGVSIPARLLTVSFVRRCKQRKIPAIFVKIDRNENLQQVPWGWIREAIFPYNCPLVPIFSNMSEKELKRVKIVWKQMMVKEKIPAILDELMEAQPISQGNLMKIGLNPIKSTIRQGAEVSYNLYKKTREIQNLHESMLIHHHDDKLLITVHNGKVIRAMDTVKFQPGFGEYIEIKTHRHFTLT
jgi:hypothetical protein